MKTLPGLFFAATLCLPALATPALAEQRFISSSQLEMGLKDGSQLKAVPLDAGLRVNPRLANSFMLKWKDIKRLDLEKGSQQAVMHLQNGDRLSVELMSEQLRIGSVLGQLSVPLESIRGIKVTTMADEGIGLCRNVALGKPVHGRDGASHGKGLAMHVTDGDPSTHAKPPGSSFDYRIDLQNGAQISYRVDQIVINWGRFGDYYKGVRQKGGEGWASGSWPGEYVTSYLVQYRKAGDPAWHTVHQFNGRPVNEDASGVEVIKLPAKSAGCSSESSTRINALDLCGVTELRVSAKGGHWIGLFELQAFGCPE